jgi:hypothetical protein
MANLAVFNVPTGLDDFKPHGKNKSDLQADS